ncbi:MAG: hypothetical protein JNK87_21650 [Bryobacterales bacterium]|nr:hypothetical protein [Bryobacterales bacterium]
MRTLLLLFTLTLRALAADATGRWTGNAEATMGDGEKRVVPLVFTFKDDAGKLTGIGGPDGEPGFTLREVKLDGAKLTFVLDTGETVANFDCDLDGDTLNGNVNATHEGRKVSAKLALKRAK